MTTQPALPFDSGHPPSRSRKGTRRTLAPYVAGSATSEAAAARLNAGQLARSQRQVLRLIAESPYGLTDNEVIGRVVRLGGSPNGPRARRVELWDAGLVEAAGVKDGSTVWVPTPRGRAVVEADG